MPPKKDTKKPTDLKPVKGTKDTKGVKGTKGSGGGVKIVNLDDDWLYHSG